MKKLSTTQKSSYSSIRWHIKWELWAPMMKTSFRLFKAQKIAYFGKADVMGRLGCMVLKTAC
jgi:hypothetical protein